MNMNDLNSVEWGDAEGLQVFLLENALQHDFFKRSFLERGLKPPSFNLFDIDIDNIDDWSLPHQNEHQFFSSVLGLGNPISLLDSNWNNEEQFYNFLSDHYFVHLSIASALASLPPNKSLTGASGWTNASGGYVPWINNVGNTVEWL